MSTVAANMRRAHTLVCMYLELELPRVAALLTLGDVSRGRHRLLGGPQRRRTRIEAVPDDLHVTHSGRLKSR